jgi:hypothetical protein
MNRVIVIRNGKQDFIMARPRKKLKENVRRHPSGEIVRADMGEKPEDVIAVALAQPHRRGDKDHRMGFAHGRMLLGGIITQRQFEAAEVFMKRAVAYMALVSGSLPRFPSVSADMVARGIACAAELTDERIAQVRSDYAELQDALTDGGMRATGNSLLVRVCIMDRDIVAHSEIGDFRCALNCIAHRLRI